LQLHDRSLAGEVPATVALVRLARCSAIAQLPNQPPAATCAQVFGSGSNLKNFMVLVPI
jgi:hypothetical protein